MSELFACINGDLLREDAARVAIGDLAVQRGYGVFDFFKTINGRPIFLDDHLDRFERSASLMRLPIGMSRDELKSLLAALMEKNKVADSGIRITLTGGNSIDGYSLAAPNLIITQKPIKLARGASSASVRLMTYPHRRQLPQVKTIDYLMAIWLKPMIEAHGADEVLYAQDGIISECPRCNFFMVLAGRKLVTPADGVLHGITRKHVLELAAKQFDAEAREISLVDTHAAVEAFITSTTRGVLPVSHINGRVIGDGAPGEVTRQLSEAIQRRIADAASILS